MIGADDPATRPREASSDMSDDRLEQLETKLAFLENANVELSDELYRHRQELEQLRLRLAALTSRLDSAAGDSVAVQDERPPHY